MTTKREEAMAVSAELAEELGQRGPEVLPRLVAEFLEVRDASNQASNRRQAVKERLMPLLEDAGGSYIDEESRQRIYIARVPRGFMYDPKALHKLVKDGKLLQSEFDDCLETTINAKKLQALLDRTDNDLTERDITRVGAKQPTRIEERLEVEQLKGARP